MINLIDRYIGRQILYSSVSILLLLVILQSSFSFISELGDTDRGNYGVSDAIIYIGLMLPTHILTFFPMSVLIGALFALGNMASNSELTVLRASGVTTWRIAGSAIKASLLLMFVVIIISEWVAPYSTKSAKQLRTTAISGGELGFSKTGLWAKRDNEIIQVQNSLNDDELRGITIYQLNENNSLDGIVKAEKASRIGNLWELSQVVETQFLADNIKTVKDSKRIWLKPLNQEQLDTLILEPEALNISGLIRYLEYLAQNGLETEVHELALWRKVMQPIVIAVMVFLATSFVFGPMRDVSMGAKILSGVMLGFGFHLASQSFGPVSLLFNIWPFIGAVAPLVIFASAGYWLMKKNR
jgi:lipopolysaccharide export system permease protein